MFFHYLEYAHQLARRLIRFFEQRLEITAKDGKWRAQFVRNIGDEIAAHLVGSAQLCDIAQQQNGAANALRSFAKGNGADFDLGDFARRTGYAQSFLARLACA